MTHTPDDFAETCARILEIFEEAKADKSRKGLLRLRALQELNQGDAERALRIASRATEENITPVIKQFTLCENDNCAHCAEVARAILAMLKGEKV